MNNEPYRIIATQVKASELNPGDLFSTAGQYYWDRHRQLGSCGEAVYIYTGNPALEGEQDEIVYRIEILKGKYEQ